MNAPLAYDGCSRLDAAGRPRNSPLYAKLLREAAAERTGRGAAAERARNTREQHARGGVRLDPLPSRAVDRVSNVPPR